MIIIAAQNTILKIWKYLVLSGRVTSQRPNAVVGPPDNAVQMLHAQLFDVNTTCHSIPLGGSGSSVTPAVPRSTFSQLDMQRGHSITDSFQML